MYSQTGFQFLLLVDVARPLTVVYCIVQNFRGSVVLHILMCELLFSYIIRYHEIHKNLTHKKFALYGRL